MGTEHFIVILAAEALLACIFVIGLVLLKYRRLQKLIAQLRARLHTLSERQRENLAKPPPQIPYGERLDEQIGATVDYHRSLGSSRDIALDLAHAPPSNRRTAALRHAFLLAEKEATANNDDTNWTALTDRYEQLLPLRRARAPEQATGAQLQEDLDQVESELQQARKRIANLERFKTMYLELEERWERCKVKANGHYSALQSMALKTGQSDGFNDLLEQYHSSYQDVDTVPQDDQASSDTAGGAPSDQLHELHRLRSMTADQHRIISELQDRLTASSVVEEKAVIVNSLQNELSKQARFLRESETCIQLMEDELANANRQLVQLRERANQTAPLITEIKSLRETGETKDQIIGSLQQEIRRLSKELKNAEQSPPDDKQEVRGLRKELSALQSNYNDLEEKFLSLKLKD